MLNLNQNFTQIKQDFLRALKQLKTYLKQVDGLGGNIVISADGA